MRDRALPKDERLIEVRDHGGRTRLIEAREIEGRVDAEAGGFSGYASTFWRIDAYFTAVAPSAFNKTLSDRRDKISVLYQHNPDWNIGFPTKLDVDAKGLYHDSTITEDNAEGSVALKRLRGGNRFGQSFGFKTLRERPATDADPLIVPDDLPEWIKANLPSSVYVIEEVKLYELSLVTFPANEDATITAIRSGPSAGALAQTLEDLRAGRLDAASRALIAQIVAAYQSAAPERSAPPRTEDDARRDREFIVAHMAQQMGLTVEQILCAV